MAGGCGHGTMVLLTRCQTRHRQAHAQHLAGVNEHRKRKREREWVRGRERERSAAQMALYIMRQTLFVLYHVHVIELIFPGPAEVQGKR